MYKDIYYYVGFPNALNFYNFRRKGLTIYTPCDIVLTIDISRSISEEAPLLATKLDKAEYNSLIVLDLVKYAARIVLKTLDHMDRLIIITFSTDIKVIQRLLPITP